MPKDSCKELSQTGSNHRLWKAQENWLQKYSLQSLQITTKLKATPLAPKVAELWILGCWKSICKSITARLPCSFQERSSPSTCFWLLSVCKFGQVFGSNAVWLPLRFYLEIGLIFYYATSKEELCYNVQFAVRHNSVHIIVFFGKLVKYCHSPIIPATVWLAPRDLIWRFIKGTTMLTPNKSWKAAGKVLITDHFYKDHGNLA